MDAARPRVLVVDDDEGFAQIVAEVLTERGYDTFSTPDPEAALVRRVRRSSRRYAGSGLRHGWAEQRLRQVASWARLLVYIALQVKKQPWALTGTPVVQVCWSACAERLNGEGDEAGGAVAEEASTPE